MGQLKKFGMNKAYNNYRIFVTFHNEINFEYYCENSLKYFTFVNVNPDNKNIYEYKNKGIDIINLNELHNYYPLGKSYAESEVIYNIYKNPDIYKNLDFIGFIHYDMVAININESDLYPLMRDFNHVSFASYSFNEEIKVKYLMDPSKPNVWIGSGKNCYSSVIEDLNTYYKQSFSEENLKGQSINLCCSFLIKMDSFKNSMSYISYIIESGKLDIYDKDRKFRMQGGIMERYFATWLAFVENNSTHFPLQHNFNSTTTTNKNRNIIDKIKNRILHWM